ncbi:MAG: TonB-dependent receptor plug domain-containing protein [Lishizhenia sp.]
MKFFNVIFLFLLAQSWAQEDSTLQNKLPVQLYKSIQIIKPVRQELIINVPMHYFDSEQIDRLQPLDVGDLLQRSPGITLKNYGDIGGLKSVSFNGLDGQHNVLILNGAKVSNPQSGLVDYSKLRTENLTSLYVSTDTDYVIGSTVDAVLAGNAVLARTFESTRAMDKLAVRFSGLYGSFNLSDLYLATKFRIKKNGFIALSGSRRDYDGDFDYDLTSQNITLSGTRRNNNYSQDQLNFGSGFNWETEKGKKLSFQLNAYYISIFNQLPGAVIAYMADNDERLSTNQFNVNGEFFIKNTFKHRGYLTQKVYANYNYDSISYVDPTYFTNPSFIEHNYQNDSYTFGYLYSLNRFYGHLIQFGIEEEVNRLSTNRNTIDEPVRFSTKAFFAYNRKLKDFYIIGRLGFINVFEQNQTKKEWRKSQNAILPSVRVNLNKFKKIKPYLSYKSSFRLPNFNELYYSQIGNINLEPERANQLKVGLNGRGEKEVNYSKRFYYDFVLFASHIKNKIQTIPTANSFIWSAQNEGNVLSFGTTITAKYTLPISDNFQLDSQISTTLQNTVNRTSEEDINFNHTLAYSPNLLGNANISLNSFGIKSTLEAIYTGSRYSLNQNIIQNRLDAYWLFNASLSRKFNIRDKHAVSLFMSVKNIFNTNNHFVRYFVLPGRNFQIKIAYAFN